MPEAPRKVTFNCDPGLFRDAETMKGVLGHKDMSALIMAALREYIVTHAVRLHREWLDENTRVSDGEANH